MATAHEGETAPRVHPARATAVANRLRPVLLHINRHLRREIHELGVTNSQVSTLAAIVCNPGIGVNDLAAGEGVAAPSMSTQLDRLQAAGLVERTRDPEGDRRRVGLRVTEEGERVLRTVRSRRTAWLAERLRGLDAESLAVIEAAIDPLSRLVERP